MKNSILTAIVMAFSINLTAQFQLTPELRELPINDITFPATHNSFNASNEGYALPNTHWTVQEQLDHGIRCFEIDIHYNRYGFLWLNSRPMVYHQELTNGALGMTTVNTQFGRLANFLNTHPNEIIFLKIERTVEEYRITDFLNLMGLIDYVYKHPDGAALPTPNELIALGKRLIITNGGGQHGWGPIYEGTPVNKQRPSQISTYDAMYSPPSPTLMWATSAYCIDDFHGAGSTNDARVINQYDWLLNYVEKIWKLNGQKTWRLVVDFPSIGNMLGVANTINNYKMIRGNVLNNVEILGSVNWECIYSDGDTINTATYGHFNFPLKPGATVKLTPISNQFQFTPSVIEVSDSAFTGNQIEIVATAIPAMAQLKSTNTKISISKKDNVIREEIKVYPMPVKNDFNVDLPSDLEGSVKVSLVDMYGKIIKNFGQFNGEDGMLKLNASDINRGVYLLKVEADAFKHVCKIVIE